MRKSGKDKGNADRYVGPPAHAGGFLGDYLALAARLSRQDAPGASPGACGGAGWCVIPRARALRLAAGATDGPAAGKLENPQLIPRRFGHLVGRPRWIHHDPYLDRRHIGMGREHPLGVAD